MEYLTEKYGGEVLFNLKLKAGMIEDYVPAKPRMKSKRLRELYKRGIINCEPDPRLARSFDEIEEWAAENMMPQDTDEENYVFSKKERNYAIKTRIDSIESGMSNLKRYRSMHPLRDDVDFMAEFFMMKNDSKKKNKKKHGKKHKKKNKKKKGYKYSYDSYKKRRVTLTDLAKGNYRPADIDDNLGKYNSILLSSNDISNVELYHELHKLGWNSYKLMKRGHVPDRIKKQFKKATKKDKKKNKKLDIQIGDDYDALIDSILEDGGYDNFAEYQRDMLDMTSTNVFR